MTYVVPMDTSPDHYKVLQENRSVRMLEMVVPAAASCVKCTVFTS